MAATTQDLWEMPDNTAYNPPELATYDPKSPKIPFSGRAVHPAVKRRRLNHSQPTSDSQASASRWFDNVNHNVTHGKQSNPDFDREHVSIIQWLRLTHTQKTPLST